MKKPYFNFSTCPKTDCKYHALEYEMNGCDYCFLTGKKRNSPSENCDKYIKCTEKERNEYRLKQMDYNNQIFRLMYLASAEEYDFYEIF